MVHDNIRSLLPGRHCVRAMSASLASTSFVLMSLLIVTTSAQLSVARYYMAAAGTGNIVMFAGGVNRCVLRYEIH